MNNNPKNPQRDPEYEARRRAYYDQKKRESAMAAQKKRYTPYYIAAVALTLLIVICICAAIVTSVLYSGVSDPMQKTYTLKMNGEKTELSTLDGNILINLDTVRSFLVLQKTGNSATPKYTAASGDSISFENDSSVAKITVSGSTSEFSVNMPIAASANSEGCMISLDTLSAVFSGITVTVDGEVVKLERKTVSSSSDKLETVSILNKSTDPLSRVLYLTSIMKEYEQYLDPADRDAYLVLVNKENPISSDYTPTDLIDLPANITNGKINCGQMRLYAAKALEAMIKEIQADEGVNILAQSGYRTYSYQSGLFNGYIDSEMAKNPALTYDEARELVLTYSALPDCSEHRTGLAIDLIDNRYNELENPFTKAYWMNWLEENAWKFGFILRYPENTEDKNYEEITGYSYESWHFRYVGRYHAERISASGLTLEEYLETLN